MNDPEIHIGHEEANEYQDFDVCCLAHKEKLLQELTNMGDCTVVQAGNNSDEPSRKKEKIKNDMSEM